MKLSIAVSALNLISDQPAEMIRAIPENTFRHLDYSMSFLFKNGIERPTRERMAENAFCAAKERGFDFVTSHAPYRYNVCRSEEEFEKQTADAIEAIRLCARFSIDRIVVHAGNSFSASREEMLEKNVRYYRAILTEAEKCGVKIMIENISEQIYNRPYAIQKAEDILELRRMLDDHPLIGACWDTGHANTIALDQYANIVQLRGILQGVHLQDNNGDHDDHFPPLMGNVNFDDVIKGLTDIGYDGSFNLETHLFRAGYEWPNYRRPFNEQAKAEKRLFKPDIELSRYGIGITYHIGRYMMEKTGLTVE